MSPLSATAYEERVQDQVQCTLNYLRGNGETRISLRGFLSTMREFGFEDVSKHVLPGNSLQGLLTNFGCEFDEGGHILTSSGDQGNAAVRRQVDLMLRTPGSKPTTSPTHNSPNANGESSRGCKVIGRRDFINKIPTNRHQTVNRTTSNPPSWSRPRLSVVQNATRATKDHRAKNTPKEENCYHQSGGFFPCFHQIGRFDAIQVVQKVRLPYGAPGRFVGYGGINNAQRPPSQPIRSDRTARRCNDLHRQNDRTQGWCARKYDGGIYPAFRFRDQQNRGRGQDHCPFNVNIFSFVRTLSAELVDQLASLLDTVKIAAPAHDYCVKKVCAEIEVLILFGSQTGTAEEVAGRLAKDLVRYGKKALVMDPEEIDVEDFEKITKIEDPLLILCVATYGEDDPTDNAQALYEHVTNSEIDLSGVKYAVFALGNKTYEHFNAVGKVFDSRLEELGATRVYEIGLGDDDANLEEDFMRWREGFLPSLAATFGWELSNDGSSDRQYRLEIVEDPAAAVFKGEYGRIGAFEKQRPPFDQKNPFLSKVVAHSELHTPASERNCKHIEFSLEGSHIRYEAGDHLAVFPTNDSTLVERLGKLIEIDLSVVFKLINTDEESSKRHPFPCPCSYQTALTHYVDICAPVKSHVLKALVEYTTDEEQKKTLTLLSFFFFFLSHFLY